MANLPNRRLISSLLVALVSWALLGGVVVAVNASDGDVQQVTVGEIHRGDKGRYQMTLGSDIPRSQFGAGVPFPIFDFEWKGASSIVDGAGRVREAEALVTSGLSFDSTSDVTFVDGEWVFGPVWQPANYTYWFEPGAVSILGLGYNESEPLVSPSDPSCLGPTPCLGLLQTGFSGDANLTVVGFPPAGMTACLLEYGVSGKTLRADGSFVAPKCRLLGLDVNRENETFHAIGSNPVMGVPALGFGSNDGALKVWYSEGLPVPTRAVIRLVLEYPQEDGDLEVEATLDLVSFQPGAERRAAQDNPSAPLGPLRQGVRPPWVLDESGFDRFFAIQDAYQMAIETPEVAGLFSNNEATYLASAYGWKTGHGDTNGFVWSFTFTDGRQMVHASVEKIDEPGLAGRPLPEGPMVPVRFPLRNIRYEVEADAPEETWAPDPTLVSNMAPSVGALAERWQVYAAPSYREQEATTWGFDTFCVDEDCNSAQVLFKVGYNLIDNKLVPDDPNRLVEGPLSFRYALSQLFVTPEGSALGIIEYDADSRFSTEIDPPQPMVAGSGQAPANIAPKWTPTPAEAVSVGFLGVLVGLAYHFWPSLKGTLFAPLFSRIEASRLEKHPVRARLLQLIEAQPGIHFQEICRTADLATGAAVHHLRKLADGNLVVVRQSGRYHCYFLVGQSRMPEAGAAGFLKSDGARKVLETVEAQAGLSHLEVAAATGLQPSTVNYHAQRLTEAGLLSARREGRNVRLYRAAA